MYPSLLCLAFFVCFVTAQQHTGIKVFGEASAGLLDPVTGVVSCEVPISLPPAAPGCQWNRGKGTRGQTSTVFYMNMTAFFTAQEECAGGKLGRLLIFGAMGPSCWGNDKPYFYLRTLAQINITGDFEDSNLAWDHTCNVVIISPEQTTEGEVYSTNQVSEYDSQQRFQPTTSEQGSDCHDCWRKVKGLGALDFGNFVGSWIPGQEWNCGETCLFYSIQEHVLRGSPTGERRIVGTFFRTGQVGLQIPDPVQAQTLSWNPFSKLDRTNQFLGIGICCSDAWCLPECESRVGKLVLFSFLPKTATVSFLADIGDVDPQAVQIGIEYSPAPYSKHPPQAYVLHLNTVLTFDLKVNDGVILAAQQTAKSPALTWGPPIMWANAGSF